MQGGRVKLPALMQRFLSELLVAHAATSTDSACRVVNSCTEMHFRTRMTAKNVALRNTLRQTSTHYRHATSVKWQSL